MIEYKGLFLPAGETHLIEWMDQMGQERAGKPAYQLHKYDAAIAYCARRRVAVDVGAHAGLMSRVMAMDFGGVVAFEPMPEHVACWKRNMAGTENAVLHEKALGSAPGQAPMCSWTPGSTGDTGVAVGLAVGVRTAFIAEVTTLDSFDLDLSEVDFLKIDCEGYELEVLRGAEKLLRACRPVVMVEQKPGHAQRYGLGEKAAVDYLVGLGAKLRREMFGDFILSW